MTNWYTKLTKVRNPIKKSFTAVPCIFSVHPKENYGIPCKLLIDNCPSCISNRFVAVCSNVAVNNGITTRYRP